MASRRRSEERLRDIGQVNASIVSLGQLGQILENDGSPHPAGAPLRDDAATPTPATMQAQQDAPAPAPRRRRRTIVRRDEGLIRRPTVTSREEGRALGLSRGASMRRVNVWDGMSFSHLACDLSYPKNTQRSSWTPDLPDQGDAPPPFPFPTTSTSRLPPTFDADPAASPTSSATALPPDHPEGVGGRPRSPPPTWEQAVGLAPLPHPPAQPPSATTRPPVTHSQPQPQPLFTVTELPESPGPSTPRPRSPAAGSNAATPRLSLAIPSLFVSGAGSGPPSPTSTHYASAPTSPVHTAENSDEEDAGGHGEADDRPDRKMWNADLLAGYTLEERVRREVARRKLRETEMGVDEAEATVTPVISDTVQAETPLPRPDLTKSVPPTDPLPVESSSLSQPSASTPPQRSTTPAAPPAVSVEPKQETAKEDDVEQPAKRRRSSKLAATNEAGTLTPGSAKKRTVKRRTSAKAPPTAEELPSTSKTPANERDTRGQPLTAVSSSGAEPRVSTPIVPEQEKPANSDTPAVKADEGGSAPEGHATQLIEVALSSKPASQVEGKASVPGPSEEEPAIQEATPLSPSHTEPVTTAPTTAPELSEEPPVPIHTEKSQLDPSPRLAASGPSQSTENDNMPIPAKSPQSTSLEVSTQQSAIPPPPPIALPSLTVQSPPRDTTAPPIKEDRATQIADPIVSPSARLSPVVLGARVDSSPKMSSTSPIDRRSSASAPPVAQEAGLGQALLSGTNPESITRTASVGGPEEEAPLRIDRSGSESNTPPIASVKQSTPSESRQESVPAAGISKADPMPPAALETSRLTSPPVKIPVREESPPPKAGRKRSVVEMPRRLSAVESKATDVSTPTLSLNSPPPSPVLRPTASAPPSRTQKSIDASQPPPSSPREQAKETRAPSNAPAQAIEEVRPLEAKSNKAPAAITEPPRLILRTPDAASQPSGELIPQTAPIAALSPIELPMTDSPTSEVLVKSTKEKDAETTLPVPEPASDAQSQAGSDTIVETGQPTRKLTRGKAIRRSSSGLNYSGSTASRNSRRSSQTHVPLFSSPNLGSSPRAEPAAEQVSPISPPPPSIEDGLEPERMTFAHRKSAPEIPSLQQLSNARRQRQSADLTGREIEQRFRMTARGRPLAEEQAGVALSETPLPPHREAALRRRELLAGSMDTTRSHSAGPPVLPPMNAASHVPPPLLIDFDEPAPSGGFRPGAPQLSPSAEDLFQIFQRATVPGTQTAESSSQAAARAAEISKSRVEQQGVASSSVVEGSSAEVPRKRPPPPPPPSKTRLVDDGPVDVSQVPLRVTPSAETATVTRSGVESLARSLTTERAPPMPTRRPPPPPPLPPGARHGYPLAPPPLPARPPPPPFVNRPGHLRTLSALSNSDTASSLSDVQSQLSSLPPLPIIWKNDAGTLIRTASRPRGPRPAPPIPPRPWAKTVTETLEVDRPPPRPLGDRTHSDNVPLLPSLDEEDALRSPLRAASMGNLRATAESPRSPIEYTDLDVLVSRLEGSGREYEVSPDSV